MSKRLVLLLIAMMGAMLMAPALATAAPVPEELHISLWPEYNDSQVLFMEGIRFPESTPLPIEVKMAVPKGAAIVWAGEIMSGGPDQDVAATPQVNPKDDYDEVVFTLTKSRIGQLEASWAGLKIDGTQRTINLEWTQRYEAKQLTFDFRQPTQATDIKMSPPASTQGGSTKGQEFIPVAPMNLAVGQKQVFNITYNRSTNAPSVSQQRAQQPAPQPQANPAGGGLPSSGVTITLIALATIVVAGLAVYKVRNGQGEADAKKSKQKPTQQSSAPKKDAERREKERPAATAGDENELFFD